MSLYLSTGGANWTNQDNWGVGEPCTNGWYGVYCCPVGFPYLINPSAPVDQQYCSATASSRRSLTLRQRLSRRRTSHATATRTTLDEIAADRAHFCDKGTSYGDDRDLSPCTVVQLRLAANGLSNTLPFLDTTVQANEPFRNTTFSNLQSFSADNNALTGEMPLWVATLPAIETLSLSNNTFTINYQTEVLLADMCDRPGVVCDGVPGIGSNCRAYGDAAVMLLPYASHCQACDASSTVEAQWYGYIGFCLAAVALYAAMVWLYAQGGHGITRLKLCAETHPTSLKGWVANSCIILTHVNMSLLVGSCRPHWPSSVRRLFACLSFEYTCFTYPECITQDTPVLALNVEAQTRVNSFLSTFLICPPLIILALVIYRALLKCHHRRMERRKVSKDEEDDPLDKALEKVPLKVREYAYKAHTLFALYVPGIELACSVLMIGLLGQTLRVARQESNTLLLLLQPFVYVLYTRDAIAAARSCKAKVQRHLTTGKLRVAYLTLPFKDRAATWQSVFFAQNVLIFLWAWIADDGLFNPAPNTSGWQTFGITMITITLIVCWALNSVYDPWESAYQNTASSRLYTCQFITLAVSAMWNRYFDLPSYDAFFETWLLISLVYIPLLSVLYLWVGAHATACARVLSEGIVTRQLPIWIRGMRYEFMPLPKGVVVIARLHEGTPTPETVHAALQESLGLPENSALNETRRSAEFKRVINRLLLDLGDGSGGSNLSMQVRRYGKAKVTREQIKSLESAKERVLARVSEYKLAITPLPPSPFKAGRPGDSLSAAPAPVPAGTLADAPADGPESASADAPARASAAEDEAPPPTLAKATTAVMAMQKLRRRSSQALQKVGQELGELLETEGEVLAEELSPEEMTLLKKLSARAAAQAEEEEAEEGPPKSLPPAAERSALRPRVGLADGESALIKGASRVGLAGGTALTTGGSSSIGLADGTVLSGDQPATSERAVDTVLVTGEQSAKGLSGGLGRGASKGIGDGLGRGESKALDEGLGRGDSQALGEGLGRGTSKALAEGLGNGMSKAKSIANGTVLMDGEDSDDEGIAAGTLLAKLHKLHQGFQERVGTLAEHEAVVKLRENQYVKETADFVVKDLFNLEYPTWKAKRAGKQIHRQAARTLENKRGRRGGLGKPSLVREPADPPELPKFEEGLPSAEEEVSYMTSLIQWLLSPAIDTSQVKEIVSAWPAKANRAEPGDEQLEKHMENVLNILQRINYGTMADSPLSSKDETRPLIELGYQVVLCLHNHRDAPTYSGRAARLRQRWYLAVIDMEACAPQKNQAIDGPPPFLVMPNAYHKQWNGKRVRVQEPEFYGGVYARGSDELVRMVREGRAIIYDESPMSVVGMPVGVRVKILHRSVRVAKTSHLDDLPLGDIGAMMRNLLGQTAPLPFAKPALADVRVEKDKAGSCSMLLHELTRFVEEMSVAKSIELGGAAKIARAFKREVADCIREVTKGITEESEHGVPLRALALSGRFPKVFRHARAPMLEDGSEEDPDEGDDAVQTPQSTGPAGFSVHLCASDTQRLAPDAAREVVVWLTIVDLQRYNPVNVATGGHLTPRNQPLDSRDSFLVPGEVAVAASGDEIEKRLEEEDQRRKLDAERALLKRQSSRLQRARLSRAASQAGLSFERGGSSSGLRAGTAASDAAPSSFTAEQDEDALDASEVEAMEAQNRNLLNQRLSRAMPLEGDLDLEAGVPEAPDRLNLGI